jgi:hypothetical protein
MSIKLWVFEVTSPLNISAYVFRKMKMTLSDIVTNLHPFSVHDCIFVLTWSFASKSCSFAVRIRLFRCVLLTSLLKHFFK